MIFHDRRRLGAIQRPFVSSAVYAGPGDVATALYHWGSRAYKNSTIGANAITIINETSLAVSTFGTVAGGGLNVTGIDGFLSAGAIGEVAVLIEQVSGSANFNGPSTSTPSSANPKYTRNAAATGKSAGTFTASASTKMTLASGITVAQPFTIGCVVRHQNLGGNENICSFGSGAVQLQVGLSTGTDYYFIWGGSNVIYDPVATTAGHFHSIIGIYNDPSNSVTYKDGTAGTAGSTGTGSLSASSGTLGIQDFATADLLDGDICELTIWSGVQSAAAIYANHVAYYGSFPI